MTSRKLRQTLAAKAYARTAAYDAAISNWFSATLKDPAPAYRAVGRIRLTNKTPGGTYRAPGRYESTFARERIIDAIAARLGLDAVAVRRRNARRIGDHRSINPV